MSGHSPRIAFVDDDARILASLENLFESAGYAVAAFSSAAAFLDAGLSGIDCLIIDIGMPGMDGFELCEVVKRAQPRLPVFLITGRCEAGDPQRAEAKNSSGFFRKPFDGPALLAAVADALR
ncbi:MAG TPA: response regulator [Caulobacteraceae bacterium]|nr:response regulator [Caulobacteraceae bacterium]